MRELRATEIEMLKTLLEKTNKSVDLSMLKVVDLDDGGMGSLVGSTIGLDSLVAKLRSMNTRIQMEHMCQ